MGKRPLRIPTWLTSVDDNGIVLGGHTMACKADAYVGSMAGFIDFMQALLCPLKYGTQGIDALRAVSDLMGPPSRR